MKERELRDHADCALCHKKILASGIPLFWRVTVERFGVDIGEVRKQTGLEMMMGGHVALAQAFSPDRDMAEPMMEPVVLAICEPCGTQRETYVMVLAECRGMKR